MVKLYLSRIKANQMTIEDVPLLWRKQVQEALDAEVTQMDDER